MNSDSPTVRVPSFAQALLCLGGIFLILSTGLALLGIDLHSLMFLALLWAGINAARLGHGFLEIRDMMASAITRALPAFSIFLLIGMVIASFMQAGTVASLIYFGLGLVSPALFLPVGLLLCAMMSLATGTSWGTAGTLGVVLIGIGEAMGIPLPLVAGMVVAGATFGDKLSPISDTTNLAAMSADTSLYRHIYAMLFTTLPSFLLMLVILVFLGGAYADNAVPEAGIVAMQEGLAGAYGMNPLVTLLPIVLLLVCSMRRVPAELTMSASILLAALIAVVYQGVPLAAVLNALWENTPGATGIGSLDDLLGRGGISSMAWTLILALMAVALGGILHHAGFLSRLLAGVLVRVRRLSSLVASTIASGVIGNMALGEAYISIILNCQLFRQHYDAMDLDKAILSRSVEEGATLTTGLIPWTTAGAFYAATLGVPVLEYAPYAFFNYLNALVSIAMAAFGVGLLRAR